jgi:hypothetical protein
VHNGFDVVVSDNMIPQLGGAIACAVIILLRIMLAMIRHGREELKDGNLT